MPFDRLACDHVEGTIGAVTVESTLLVPVCNATVRVSDGAMTESNCFTIVDGMTVSHCPDDDEGKYVPRYMLVYSSVEVS